MIYSIIRHFFLARFPVSIPISIPINWPFSFLLLKINGVVLRVEVEVKFETYFSLITALLPSRHTKRKDTGKWRRAGSLARERIKREIRDKLESSWILNNSFSFVIIYRFIQILPRADPTTLLTALFSSSCGEELNMINDSWLHFRKKKIKKHQNKTPTESEVKNISFSANIGDASSSRCW